MLPSSSGAVVCLRDDDVSAQGAKWLRGKLIE
jgi:hypothetical protein